MEGFNSIIKGKELKEVVCWQGGEREEVRWVERDRHGIVNVNFVVAKYR